MTATGFQCFTQYSEEEKMLFFISILVLFFFSHNNLSDIIRIYYCGLVSMHFGG